MRFKTHAYFFILLANLIFSQSLDKIGSVSLIEGSCNVENIELNRQLTPLLGNSIFNYDIISSDNNSYCEILFDDRSVKIRIDSDTKIKVITDDYSKVIKLINGSLYIETAKVQEKVYIQTLHNDIYANNNKVWIYSNDDFDQIISLKTYLNVYNKLINSNIELIPLLGYKINRSGELEENLVFDLPDYILKEKNIKNKKNNDGFTSFFIHEADFIPHYKNIKRKKNSTNNGFYFDFIVGSRYMNSKAYSNIGFFPAYKYNNLIISSKLDFYINSDGKVVDQNWLDKNSILEKFNLNYFYSDYENTIKINIGEIEKASFGYGYLVNSISNSFDYPFNNFGININYKLDNDFMEFQFLMPSIRDCVRGGGVFGFHSSLFLSYKFPLTIGFGFIKDFNQFTQYKQIYNFPDNYEDYKGLPKRDITAAEFDFNFDLVKKMNLNVSIFSEIVGKWYPSDVHYVRNDGTGSFGSVSKVSRKGTWGLMAPGIAVEFNNKHKIKFALNYNSAGYYPSYFNTNYLYNRAIYYKVDEPLDFNNQNFILLTEQIDMLNSYAINEELTEFMLPKEIYPMLLNKFNASPVRGFTIEYDYQFKNKVNFSSLLSRFEQNIALSPNYVYYTMESNISIKDGYLKNISNLDFYFQNIFFIGDQDKQELVFGSNIGIKITPIISLILDVSQVYYDSDLDGIMLNELEFLNFGLNIGANF